MILLVIFWGLSQIVSTSTLPEQVHLNYISSNSMGVTWITQEPVKSPQCLYTNSKNPNPTTIIATSRLFSSETTKREFWVHFAIFGQLEGGGEVIYSCGSDGAGWTPNFNFFVPLGTPPYTLAVFGDLGFDNAVCFDLILREAQKKAFDMIIHLGDYAYDMNTNNSYLGDQYMNMIEPITQSIPYQVAVGNHESDENNSYLNYRLRFNMNQQTDSLFYSWNLGPIHFISIMGELYYTQPSSLLSKHYAWLVDDLHVTNLYRNLTPWIVVYNHRPLYCSNPGCNESTVDLRDGVLIDGKIQYGIEELLYNYGVDFYFCGHEHSYERLLPIYKGKALNQDYQNPKATIQIIGGAAGNKEGPSSFPDYQPPWSAFRSSKSSIGHLTIFNNTHAYWDQVLPDGTILDQIWVTTTHHGPFGEVL